MISVVYRYCTGICSYFTSDWDCTDVSLVSLFSEGETVPTYVKDQGCS